MGHHPTNRAERRAERDRIIANRMRDIYSQEKPWEWDEWKQKCIEGKMKYREANARGRWFRHPGKFHKKKPYDCGISQCPHCHWEKVFRPKKKRLVAKEVFRTLLKDLGL